MKKIIMVLLVVLFMLTSCKDKKKDIDLLDADYNDVTSIEVLDGESGNKLSVTKTTDLEYLISCFNSLELEYDKSAKGIDGFKYSVNILFKNEDSKKFIVNSKERIIYNSNFYNLISGDTGYDKITELYLASSSSIN